MNSIDAALLYRPVNKQSALVVSENKHYFEIKPKDREELHHFKEPPIDHITFKKKKGINQVNIGFRFGRFIVFAYRKPKGNRKSRKAIPSGYLCRCVCGDYEFRTARAIRNILNVDDRCSYCRKRDFIVNKNKITVDN